MSYLFHARNCDRELSPVQHYNHAVVLSERSPTDHSRSQVDQHGIGTVCVRIMESRIVRHRLSQVRTTYIERVD